MEWHVWDFPDNIRVYLNDSFRMRIYGSLIEICGTRIEVARRLNSNKETIRASLCLGFRKGKKAYIRLGILRRIIEVFGEELWGTFLVDLEDNIVSYRAWNGKDVNSPLLPVKDGPGIYSLVFHLIGDGNSSIRHSPFYSNKCRQLVEEFQNNLKLIGSMDTRIVRREDGLVKLYFPKAVSDILSSMFNTKFTHPTSLPEKVFSAPNECKLSAIKAFVDDEGSISSSFCITQKSSIILEQFKELLYSVGISTGKVCVNNNVHKLYVSRLSYKRFSSIIELTHADKRQNLLKKIK